MFFDKYFEICKKSLLRGSRNVGQYSYHMNTQTSTGARGNKGLGTNLAR
jgi:hypothetical protein